MKHTLPLYVTAMLAATLSMHATSQAIAPVTEQVKDTHNPSHPRVVDPTRIVTDRTAVPLKLPAEEDMFVFAVFGDRTGGPNLGIDVLAKAVNDVNLIEPDLVMTVGDMIQGYNQTPDWLEQMSQFKGVMDRLLPPWFPVAGNHDVYWRGPDPAPPGEHERSYEMHFGPLWYAFEHKDCWFIALYTDEGNPGTGLKAINRPESQRMSPAQLAWLRQTLDKAKDAPHVFVFVHHPRWIGGNYGDDWNKVHELLVDAGNVSAVFGGHIHRMRYDPRDGIEYVALATVGGYQRGSSPAAGFLHHFNLVTVRNKQIALSSIPVGGVMDVRAITGEVSEMADTLAELAPQFDMPARATSVSPDAAWDERIELTLVNPVDAAIELELVPHSDDARWTVFPDHEHLRLEPKQSRSVAFRVTRPQGATDVASRPLILTLRTDLLTEQARFPITPVESLIPGTLLLAQPPSPPRERALRLDGLDDAAAIDASALRLNPDATLTLEAWVYPQAVTQRDGIVGCEAFGLHLAAGVPEFSVQTDDGQTSTLDAARLAPLPLNRWTHLAGVYDGTEIRLYIDGKPAASAAATGPIKTPDTWLTFGAEPRQNGHRNSLAGYVDDICIRAEAAYNAAFTPTRRPAPAESTRLLLRFDAELGGYVFEDSPAGNHTRLYGDAAVVTAP